MFIMGSGSKTRKWSGPSRRRAPRYRMQNPLEITVLRSGIPDTVPGRALNICEGGVAAVLAGELLPGETVALELRISMVVEPLRTRAIVRYQDKLQCGLEFVGITPEQRAAIRDWVKEAKHAPQVTETVASLLQKAAKKDLSAKQGTLVAVPAGKRRAGRIFLIAGFLLSTLGAAFWWRWNRSWQQIEAAAKGAERTSAEKPEAQVAADVMQKLLIHRVEPVYPAEARKRHLQGVIALDVVVGRDGSVASMRPLNGPDVLAQAAMDALRWWKFEPFRVNGEPAVVETTLAVEFK
jgi:TonB family protein